MLLMPESRPWINVGNPSLPPKREAELSVKYTKSQLMFTLQNICLQACMHDFTSVTSFSPNSNICLEKNHREKRKVVNAGCLHRAYK